MNATEKQLQLFRLCIENNLGFETSPKNGLIQVREFDNDSEFLFNEYIYVDDQNAVKNINSLIAKVENHVSAKMELA